MPPTLRLDRGTLVMTDAPEAVRDFFTWDDRSQSWRAPGGRYREIVEALRAAGLPFKDSAAAFEPLHLGYARDVTYAL